MAAQPSESKVPTRFDKFMFGVGKTTEKLKKQASKTIVNSKIKMQNKINNVQPTPEDQEIISALERLKTTKNEITAISDNIRNLYGTYIEYTHQVSLLSNKLSEMRVDNDDQFAAYSKSLGETLSYIDATQTDYAQKMLEKYVIPMEKFRDSDVDELQTMKLKYKTLKSNYDVALANLGKANESQDANKIAAAQSKRDECKNELNAFRLTFKSKLDALEKKKQKELLSLTQEYWKSYELYINNLLKTVNNKAPYINKDYYGFSSNSKMHTNESQESPYNNNNNNNYNNYDNNNNNNDNDNNNNYNNNYNNNNNNNNNNDYDQPPPDDEQLPPPDYDSN